jgi:hypothetical protein
MVPFLSRSEGVDGDEADEALLLLPMCCSIWSWRVCGEGKSVGRGRVGSTAGSRIQRIVTTRRRVKGMKVKPPRK